MNRQDSETELVGRLAASLTPSVPRAPLQQRGEQSSGLFDIGAMYAASVEQVMRRAQRARQAPPIVERLGIAEAPRSRPVGRPVELSISADDVEFIDEVIHIPGVTPRGRIGWFSVAVAWLAVASLAAVVATALPAHGLRRILGPAPVAATTPVLAPAPTTSTPTAIPAAPPTATAPPAATATSTTLATTLTAASAVTPPPAKVRAAPPRPHPAVHPLASDSPVAAPVAAPPKASTANDVVAAAAPVAPVPKAVAQPKESPAAAPAGTSLEDLIRQAVAAESKHR